MTFAVAKRCLEFYAPFATLFAASAISALTRTARRPLSRPLLAAGGLVLLGASLSFSFPWYQHELAAVGVEPDRLRPAAQWLRANTRPEDMVFNLTTDSFGELTFWGARNQFLQGQDTFFLYAYDPRLFYETSFIFMNIAPGKTWRTTDPVLGEEVDLSTALGRDFGARYILVTKPESAPLGQCLDKDPAFRRCFESAHADLYVVSKAAPSPH